MKISEKWAISGQRADFTLTESLVRKDEKTGKDKVVSKQTYHPTIEQCLRKIIKAETNEYVQSGDGATVQGLLDHLTTINNDIKESARAIEAAVPAHGQQTDTTDLS